MLRTCRLAAFGTALGLLAATAMAQQEGTLVVANRFGGSISLIDLPTGFEIARLPIGPTIPHETAVSPDGRFALTAEYGPNNAPGQHVVLIDIVDAKIVARIDLGPKSRPHSVLFHPDGQHAIATMQDSDLIAVIDLKTLKVVRTACVPVRSRAGWGNLVANRTGRD